MGISVSRWQLQRFERFYGSKYVRAMGHLRKEDSPPAECGQSVRRTNPIAPTFAAIRHMTKRAQGCLSRSAMLHMIFKLWRYEKMNRCRQRGSSSLDKVSIGASSIEVAEAADQKGAWLIC